MIPWWGCHISSETIVFGQNFYVLGSTQEVVRGIIWHDTAVTGVWYCFVDGYFHFGWTCDTYILHCMHYDEVKNLCTINKSASTIF